MCLTKVKKACNTISKVSVLRCFLYKTHYREDFWEWTPQMSGARAAISPRSSCSLIGLLCYPIGLFWDFSEWTPQMSGARAATSPGSLLLPNRAPFLLIGLFWDFSEWTPQMSGPRAATSPGSLLLPNKALLLLIGLFWDFSEWTPQMSGPRAAISPTGLLWSRAWWGWGRCWREWALARPRPSWGWVPIRRCNTLSRPVILFFTAHLFCSSTQLFCSSLAKIKARSHAGLGLSAFIPWGMTVTACVVFCSITFLWSASATMAVPEAASQHFLY